MKERQREKECLQHGYTRVYFNVYILSHTLETYTPYSNPPIYSCLEQGSDGAPL